MTDFHGYPQHPDAQPERPWWRKIDGTWTRADGIRCVSSARGGFTLIGIDAANPIPAPPPRCGQVWSVSDGLVSFVIVAVAGDMARYVQALTGETHLTKGWPPPGAALVAGPGAPWAPMGDA